MITVISANDPSRAQDNARPGTSPSRDTCELRYIFSFPLAICSQGINILLTPEKNSAPTLGLKAPVCEALRSHC